MSRSPSSPFRDLREALAAAQTGEGTSTAGDDVRVRIDAARWRRTGIPEVVHAETKTSADVAEALSRIAGAQGRALASRVREDDIEAIRSALEPGLAVEIHAVARCVVVAQPGVGRPTHGGTIGVVSAGSSDIPVASEAALMAAEMGAEVLEAWDVGVAGLHRLVEPLEQFAASHVDVIVVAAGMDGALPSVVAGLVDVPVIGLPTSVGYGFGGGGVGAMTSMLQSCAPGLVVVNIDNGIGAGATAARFAIRAARSRSAPPLRSGGDGFNGATG